MEALSCILRYSKFRVPQARPSLHKMRGYSGILMVGSQLRTLKLFLARTSLFACHFSSTPAHCALQDIVCIGTCRGDKGSRNLVVFEDGGLGSFSRTI